MSRKFLRATVVAPLFVVSSAAGSAAAVEVNSDRATCEDAIYRVYNSCLMSSSNIWQRALCDVAFELNMMSCVRS